MFARSKIPLEFSLDRVLSTTLAFVLSLLLVSALTYICRLRAVYILSSSRAFLLCRS